VGAARAWVCRANSGASKQTTDQLINDGSGASKQTSDQLINDGRQHFHGGAGMGVLEPAVGGNWGWSQAHQCLELALQEGGQVHGGA